VNRAEKAEFIESVRADFVAAPLIILTDFKGITVKEIDKVRRVVEASGAKFRVVKNTLARVAVSETEMAPLSEQFVGNIGVVFSSEDAQKTAKMFRTLRKENDKLQLKGGYFDGQVLDPAGIEAVAELPSREQLLSTLLATMQEAPRQVLGVIQGPARDLLYVLNNFAAKLGE
jgi:large subunit ribosomal protein L10